MTRIYHLPPGRGSGGRRRAGRRRRAALLPGLLLGLAVPGPGGPAGAAEVFRDVTEKAGIRFQHVNGAAGRKHLYETMIGGAGWFDFDGDGLLDLFVVQGHDDSERAFEPGRQSDVLYRNRGDGTFEDVTARAGVGDRHYGSGLAVADIDNDGDLDLYVTNVGPNTLYLNHGDGTFKDLTREAGVECPGWSTSAAFADIDSDGLLDLYVCNYLRYDPRVHGPCTGNPKKIPAYCHPNKFEGAPDCLFWNRGGAKFQDISRPAGVAVAGPLLGKGLGVLPTDYDGDGRIDFFVANDSVPDFLWRNLGQNRFEDVALEAGVALNSTGQATASMGIDGGDVNGDGLLDYLVTNFSEEVDTLFLGEKGGFFADGSARSGIAEITYLPLGFGMRFFDQDLDGDLDIYIANGHILDNVEVLYPGTRLRYGQPDLLLENDGRGRFREISSTSGDWFRETLVGRGLAGGDYDQDGDLDLFVVNVGQRGVLLENTARQRDSGSNHWVGLQVRGNGPANLNGYGSRLDLKVSGRETTVPLEVRSAASYQSANDPRQLWGLGKDGTAEWVRVRWPDGLTEVFRSLKRDAYNLLERGKGEAEKTR